MDTANTAFVFAIVDSTDTRATSLSLHVFHTVLTTEYANMVSASACLVGLERLAISKWKGSAIWIVWTMGNGTKGVVGLQWMRLTSIGLRPTSSSVKNAKIIAQDMVVVVNRPTTADVTRDGLDRIVPKETAPLLGVHEIVRTTENVWTVSGVGSQFRLANVTEVGARTTVHDNWCALRAATMPGNVFWVNACVKRVTLGPHVKLECLNVQKT